MAKLVKCGTLRWTGDVISMSKDGFVKRVCEGIINGESGSETN